MLHPTGYIDGRIAPLDEIRVPVLDRGFLYGDSIYEVFRTYSGIPFMFDQHHARLENSARLCKMDIRQSKREIIAAIRRTVAASGADSAAGEDIYVRYQITRGEGPIDLFPHPRLQSRLIIIVKQIPQWQPQFYTRGITLAIPELRRNAVSALDPNIKGGNYLNNILGLAEARALGADECLLLDADGMVSECSNSNIWFALDGKLATPAGGNLSGLTRQALVGELERAGHSGIERPLRGAELPAARECFITSATREVMPVARLQLQDGNSLAFPEGGGELTQLARRLYADMLARFVREHRGEAWC
ncbi:MAG: aminotransferase class IV [Gammaproteobacteria bacterium]